MRLLPNKSSRATLYSRSEPNNSLVFFNSILQVKQVTLDLDIFFSLKFKTVLIEIMKNHEIKKMEGESLYTLLW